MEDLAQVLRQLPQLNHPDVLVGTALPDDAGVYRLRADLAVVQSVDVFTPVVDDPYDYGRIAAANALSDIYAMGADPLFALNIVGFPVNALPTEVLVRILQGGADKAQEAGVVILGGHTLDDAEPKYGLVVTGVVAPDRLITNVGARPGDVLVLTKPLGMGTITTAIKQGKAREADITAAVEIMATLNAPAKEAMLEVGVHACTDITGYGLLGHLHELLLASRVAAEVVVEQVPVLEAAWAYAMQDIFPGGTRTNQRYLEAHGWVTWPSAVPNHVRALLYDAQTSGGLLIAVAAEKAEALVDALRQRATPAAAVIGHVVDGPPGHITLV